MPGVVLPPYASPSGPELSLDGLLDAFLEGARSGFSADFHIEDDMLLAERMVPFGVRLGPRSLLLRGDLPRDTGELLDAVAGHLRARGLTEIEPDTRLGDIAAIQVTGVRGAVWNLWGAEPDEAKRMLEAAAVGGDATALRPEPAPADDSGVGMTLEELIGEEKGEPDQGD